jgi:hypothetical protein
MRSSFAHMSSQAYYRKLAENCLRMAESSRDPQIAAALRALAADYLDMAVEQRQQPKEPPDK